MIPRMATQTHTSGFSATRWLCRMTVRAFGLLYIAVLTLQGISWLGLFGFAPKPLAGVFLVVIGLPWTLAAAWFPDALQPLVAALAPLATLVLLWTYCHWPRRRDWGIAGSVDGARHSRRAIAAPSRRR